MEGEFSDFKKIYFVLFVIEMTRMKIMGKNFEGHILKYLNEFTKESFNFCVY